MISPCQVQDRHCLQGRRNEQAAGTNSLPSCPDAGWLKGTCSHGNVRWVKLACKRRTCEVCGEHRKKLIAWRISRGIELLGGVQGGAWFVGTFSEDLTKAEAVKVSNQLVQWLRRYMKRKFGIQIEFAKVWEVHRNGRLHLNLVIAPWRYIPQRLLSQKWHSLGGGPVVWVERVGAGIGVEAAKSKVKVGNYLAKYDQMVLTGRGVSYSKGWPKLPDLIKSPRQGRIWWWFVGNLSEESRLHWYEVELGHWREVVPGEWCNAEGEDCHCFEFKNTS